MKSAVSGMDGKRVLVTGGAGFLGSHLCERLLVMGARVVCVDNFSTGRRVNILPFLTNPCFELLEQDICEPLLIEVDQIYNLACPASPVHYQADPIQTTRTCVVGSLNLLNLAQKLKVPILQASTSEVYGDPEVHPQPESYRGNVNSIGPRACYDEGKRCAETLFFDYHRRHATRIKVARIFNTYGPRMRADDGRVVSNFIAQALTSQPLTVYGEGTQTRSFCYVDDLVEGLIRLMATADGVTGPVNLGNPAEVTMLQLAQLVQGLTGAGTVLQFRPLPEDDPLQRCPDIRLAQQLLGWKPECSLAEGLRRTIEAFRRRLEQG